MIHIITIVHEDAPFLLMQLPEFNRLSVPWRWHIVPGSNARHNAIPRESGDETNSLVFDLARHSCVTTYAPTHYASKSEQDSRALCNMPDDALILYKDADEIWTAVDLEGCLATFASGTADVGIVGFKHYVRPDVYLVGDYLFQHRFYRRNGAKAFLKTTFQDPPALVTSPVTMCLDRQPRLSHYAYIRPKQVLYKAWRNKIPEMVSAWQALDSVKNFPADVSHIFPFWNENGLMAYKDGRCAA